MKKRKNYSLWRRCFHTLLVLFLIRVFYSIPTPGVNSEYFKSAMGNNPALLFLNSITGNGLSNLSVMALSIGPYITASIVIQLFTILIPKLEELQNGTKNDRDKVKHLTFLFSIAMAMLQSYGMAAGFGRKGMLVEYNWKWTLVVMLTWTLSSTLTAWIGNKMMDMKHTFIGNGISLILVSNIIVSYPAGVLAIADRILLFESVTKRIVCGIATILGILFLFGLTVYWNGCEKRIKVVYANKAGGSTGIIPIKLFTGGVVPVIFASSIMSFPVMIAGFFGKENMPVFRLLNMNEWFQMKTPLYSAGVIIYILLIFAYSYLYSNISFNPFEISRTIERNGGTISGIRNGQPAVQFLQKQTRRMTILGACCMSFIALVPIIVSSITGITNISFLGTSMLIVVGVVLDTKKQIITQNRSLVYKKRGGKTYA